MVNEGRWIYCYSHLGERGWGRGLLNVGLESQREVCRSTMCFEERESPGAATPLPGTTPGVKGPAWSPPGDTAATWRWAHS